ncbi:MAG: alkaline phosphatase D family protein [Casimicrobiaceae bacterium]
MPLPAESRLVVMQGYADYTSAVLWVQVDGPGPVAVDITPEVGGETRQFTFEPAPDNDHAASLRVPGLRPGTGYRYQVRGGGEVRDGRLSTQAPAPRSGNAPEIVIAFGSCHFVRYPDPAFATDNGGDYQIFDAIAAKAPNLMLWLGDNLYLQTPDFADPSAMAAHYREARAFAPLQRLFGDIPQLAIWDDHDYGPNDGDRSYVFKDETLRLFKRYWPNPSHGLPGVPGVFGWVHLGDVDLFLLDDRYHRYPNRYPNVPEKSMFGSAQFEWLKEALLSSRARIKIVANGSQFWNRASRFEGLHQFPDEQRRLAQWLAERPIDGVIFLSGDRHFGELLRVPRDGTYPLYEFTSSPLTYRAYANPDAAERDNPALVPGTLTTRRNFGMLRVTGPVTRRTIAFEAYDSDGALLWKHAIAAGDLRAPRQAR